MIRIAFVVNSMHPGGMERSITRIVNGLDTDRFDPFIICLDRTGAAEHWLRRKVPIIEVKKQSGNDWDAVRRLSKNLKNLNIDVVQSHNWATLVECVIARKLARTRRHIHAERGTVMGTVSPKGLRHWARAKVMSMALRAVDRVMSNSHSVADRVQQRCGYDANKIEIIPNGVPSVNHASMDQVRKEIRGQLGISTETIVLGSVGRLTSVKGFENAIHAFSQVSRQDPSLEFLLVGDGPEHVKLSQIAKKNGVGERVHFAGYQNRADAWLSAMDIYVNSSHSEGMSQSVVEAMAVGLPVVATDVGDNARLIGHPELQCGLVCNPDDSNSLARSMQIMIDDLPCRTRFSRHAITAHQKFYSEPAFLDAMQSLYTRVHA